MAKKSEDKKIPRWYFGGIASAGAACCTHPLDLLKVHLQTQSDKSIGLIRMGFRVVKGDGVLGLYNGLSASLLRQLTYSMTRFAIYDHVKNNYLSPDPKFYQMVLLGGFAGATGGLVGTPADMVNVRMQNDMKLPKEQRRNYKHALDGLHHVYKTEGAPKLMSGATMASSRATFVTIGQLSMYDQFKRMLMMFSFFKDDPITHFSASFLAGATATLITMPLDVMKTRMMNAEPGKYKGLADCAMKVVKTNGPLGFFKGFLPAFVRLGPQTVITFMLFEQLRLNFGFIKEKNGDK